MKTDPRTRYTKSVIQDAFLALLHKKPLAKITVSEICQMAEINRGTFYRYYLDVYDLAEKMMAEGIEHFSEIFDQTSEVDFIGMLAAMLRILKNDQQLFYMVFSESFSRTMQAEFFEKVFMLCFNHLKDDLPGDSTEKTRTLSFLSGGSAALIQYWMRSGYAESEEEMAKIISDYAGRLIKARS